MTLPVRPPVAPMLAKLSRDLPRSAGLFYEPKWDGFRCIVFRDGDDVELGSRNEKPLTRYFPELVESLRRELPDRMRARRRDRHRRPPGSRVRRAVPAHPSGREAHPPTGRVDAGLLRRLRPLGPGRPLAARGAVRQAPRRAREAAEEGPPAGPPHPGDRRPRRGGGLVLPLRGGRARRRGGQGRRTHLPARQAGHGQGQAPAHRRLRGGGVPHPQGRRGGGLAAARPLRPRPGRCTTSAWRPGSAWPAEASWWPSSSPTGRTRRRTTRGRAGPTPRRRAGRPGERTAGTPART